MLLPSNLIIYIQHYKPFRLFFQNAFASPLKCSLQCSSFPYKNAKSPLNKSLPLVQQINLSHSSLHSLSKILPQRNSTRCFEKGLDYFGFLKFLQEKYSYFCFPFTDKLMDLRDFFTYFCYHLLCMKKFSRKIPVKYMNNAQCFCLAKILKKILA